MSSDKKAVPRQQSAVLSTFQGFVAGVLTTSALVWVACGLGKPATDIQTISGQWAQDLTALLNQNSPGQATLATFPKTDHGLMRHDSFEALREAMTGGSYNPAQPGEHYNQDVARQLIDWMDRSQKG